MSKILISMAFFLSGAASQACKMTTLGASMHRIEAVMEYIQTNASSHSAEISAIHMTDNVVVDMIDGQGRCTATMYSVSWGASCQAVVTTVPTFAPIACK
jgi:hypothetical protein